MRKLKGQVLLAALLCLLLALTAGCHDKNKVQPTPPTPTPQPTPFASYKDIKHAGGFENKEGQAFIIAYATDFNKSKQNVYLQGFKDLSDPKLTIDWVGKGFALLENERGAHAYRNYNGHIYSLKYRNGDIRDVDFNAETGQFIEGKHIDTSVAIGNKNMRFTLLNNTNYGSVHEISGIQVKEGDKVVALAAAYNLGMLNLTDMRVEEVKKGTVHMPNGMDKEGYFISRIHSPVITGGKIYYGAQVAKYPTLTHKAKRGDGVDTSTGITATLVFDYPSFENPTVLMYKEKLGSTTGYRSRNMFLAEDNKTIYQVTGWEGGKAYLLTIIDGKYQEQPINVAAAAGEKGETKTFGWFYAGNGIAYIPYEKGSAEPISITKNPKGDDTKEYPWGIARVDIKSGKVIDLKVPSHAMLTQFIEACIRGGKIYFPITPINKEATSYDGHVCIWDVASENPEPHVGAKLIGATDAIYSAIF